MTGSNFKMLQIQLKWQLPAPKCCKEQGKRAETDQNNNNMEQQNPETIPDPGSQPQNVFMLTA
jgi:hypothetical protein